MEAHRLLEASYTALTDALRDVDPEQAWASTRCTGWTVHDLVHHLLADAQRALVAFHTPADGPADTDEVSYWRAWQPASAGSAGGGRDNRIAASLWTFAPLARLYADTARAAVAASAALPGDRVVTTQGKRLSVAALRSTLAVEVTVHQLDLGLGAPAPAGLAEVRHVLDGLLGTTAPVVGDARYALVGTGREALTDDERTALGPTASAFPLFG